jgi:sortase A
MRVTVQWRRIEDPPGRRWITWAELLFLLLGLAFLGFAAFSYLQATVYQTYENWHLDKSLTESLAAAVPKAPAGPISNALQSSVRNGAVIGRIDISRIGVSVIVVEGVASRNLKLGAGHIPGTALPGEPGNVGIAAHRDTFFRRLREIRSADTITLTTLAGSYRYAVESADVVAPTDIQVLAPSSQPRLTLVTCYPFYFVGSAPMRFVVRAHARTE